jgi:hypothetical protein
MGNQNPNIPQSPEPSATSEGQPTPYDGNRVTPDNMGIGNQIGNGVSDAGQLAGQYAQIQKKAEGDANMAAAVDLQTQYIRGRQTKLYGDGTDANPGFFSLEGQNAIAKSGDVLNGLEADRQKLRAGAANEDQKTAFDKLTIPHVTSYREQIESYTNKQVRVAHQAVYNGSNDTALDAIGNAARTGMVDDVNTALDRQRKIIGAEALTRGIGQPVQDPADPTKTIPNPAAAQMQAAWKQKAVTAALQGFMSGNSTDDTENAAAAHLAQGFLNEHKDDLDPASLKQWTDSVKSLATHVDASATTNKLLTDATDSATHRIDWNKVQPAIDALPEGEKKYAVEKMALERSLVSSKFQDQRGHILANQIATLGDPNNTGQFKMPAGPQAEQMRAQLNAADPTLLRNLDTMQNNEELRALRQEKIQRGLATQQEKAEQRDAVNSSRTAALNARGDLSDNPDKYSGMTSEAFQSLLRDPEKFGGYMSPKDQGIVFQKFLDAKKQPPGKLSDQTIRDQLQGAGIKDKTKQNEATGIIGDAVQKWMDNERQTTGKPPSQSAIIDQIKGHLQKGDVPGGGRIYGDANDVFEYQWTQEHKPGGRFESNSFNAKQGSAPAAPVAAATTPPENARAAAAAKPQESMSKPGLIDRASDILGQRYDPNGNKITDTGVQTRAALNALREPKSSTAPDFTASGPPASELPLDRLGAEQPAVAVPEKIQRLQQFVKDNPKDPRSADVARKLKAAGF